MHQHQPYTMSLMCCRLQLPRLLEHLQSELGLQWRMHSLSIELRFESRSMCSMHFSPMPNLQSQFPKHMLQLFTRLLPQPKHQPMSSLCCLLRHLPDRNRLHDLCYRIHQDQERSHVSRRLPMCSLQLPLRYLRQHSKLLHQLHLRI
jgi:hypothetical protein